MEAEEFRPLGDGGADKTRGPMKLAQSLSKWQKRWKLAQLREFAWGRCQVAS